MKPDELDTLLAAEKWLSAGHGVALGTVVNTWGSAPRPPGSIIAVCDDGRFMGSVSGGCIESAIIEEALSAIKDGRHRVLSFGVQDETAWSLGLACGGHIEVFVESLPRDAGAALSRWNAARHAGQAIVRAIDCATGETRLVEPNSNGSALEAEAARAATADRCGHVDVDDHAWFLAIWNPAIDVVIVGAVHIAQPLAVMARYLGYRVRIIDPRPAFATAERFPGVALIQQWPEEALMRHPLGTRSAVVTLSHAPKIDDPALAIALRSDAFYIGALGSRRAHAARLVRLRDHGFEDTALARIHGPVGLPIGARTPEEIALSVLAQITERMRTG